MRSPARLRRSCALIVGRRLHRRLLVQVGDDDVAPFARQPLADRLRPAPAPPPVTTAILVFKMLLSHALLHSYGSISRRNSCSASTVHSRPSFSLA